MVSEVEIPNKIYNVKFDNKGVTSNSSGKSEKGVGLRKPSTLILSSEFKEVGQVSLTEKDSYYPAPNNGSQHFEFSLHTSIELSRQIQYTNTVSLNASVARVRPSITDQKTESVKK